MVCFEKLRLHSHQNLMPLELMPLKSLSRMQSSLKVVELVWSSQVSPKPEGVIVKVHCDVEQHSQQTLDSKLFSVSWVSMQP